MNNKIPEKRFLILLFLSAVSLRILYALFLKHNYFFYQTPAGDTLYYQNWAEEILRGNWELESRYYGLPLYPYFLALLKGLSLNHLALIRAAHFLLGALNCLLAYFVGKKLFSQKVAVLSSILMTVNFVLIFYDWLMLPVTLLISLSLIITLAFLHLDLRSKKREWFIFGILTGLSILGDGKFLILFLLLIGYWAARHKTQMGKWLSKAALPLLAGLLVILGLNVIKNRILLNDWIFVSAQSGLSFYSGNGPTSQGIFDNLTSIRPTHFGQDEDQKIIAEQALGPPIRPSEVSSFWYGKAFEFIRRSPVQYAALLAKKLTLFFREVQPADEIDLLLQQKWKGILDVNPIRVILPLALLGIILASYRRENTAILNLSCLSQLIFTVIFFFGERHRASVLPFLIIFESYLIIYIVEKARQREWKTPIAACGCCLILFFALRPVKIDSGYLDFLRHARSGPVYAERGDYEKAKEQYFLALKLEPRDTNTLYNLAVAYSLEHNFLEAQKYFLRAVDLNPREINALYNLGYTYEMLSNPALALNIYQKVIDLAPQSFDAHYRMATVYKTQGDCRSATEHYRAISKINPRFSMEVGQLISQCQPKPSQ